MNRIIKLLAFFLGNLIVFGLSPANAGSVGPELIELISTQRNSTNIDVIIKFKDKLDISKTSGLEKNKLIRKLKSKLDNKQISVNSLFKFNKIKTKNLWLSNSIAASIPSSLIPAIASQKNVLTVIIDKKITLDSTGQGSPPLQPNWNMTTIGADTVWGNGITGDGIIIGSMDTGVDINHPDLSASWRGGSNSWFDPYGFYTAPHDSNGHGTQTTSIITGGNSTGNFLGVAPSAKWIAAKIFDDTDTASLSAIHLAFQWMLDPDGNPETDDGADIINNSWNFGTIAGQCDYEFQEDISILRSADIAVVFSAGNSGPSPETSHSPANNEDTIPIGAIDESLNTAFFSSQGPSACDEGVAYPTLMAPGVNIITADLTFGGILTNSFTYSSGTSYSAPHVSGALALLQSKFPSSSLDDREKALDNTATENKIIDVGAAMQFMDGAQLILPSGNTPAPFTYSWNAIKNTTSYKLRVVDEMTGITVIDEMVTSDVANCVTSTICTITSTFLLPNGNYSWGIQTQEPFVGPWSTFLTFTVGSPPPVVALISPVGNMAGANPSPVYTWNSTSSATNYRLLVINMATGNYVIDHVSSANSTCMEDICSATSSTSLADGSYWWGIQSQNSFGVSPWVFEKIIVGTGTAPVVATLTSPTGNTNVNPTPTYEWNEVTSATDYRLLVIDMAGNYVTDTVNLANICVASVCSVTPSTPNPLPDGTYWWGVRAQNLSGVSPWTFMKFSTGSGTAPNATILTSPSGNIGINPTPTYTWEAVTNATNYRLLVIDITDNSYEIDEVNLASSVCTGTTCSITPTTALPSGNYWWGIRAQNTSGVSPWIYLSLQIQ